MLGIDQLMGNDVADFIYSDPPWGPAAIKNFATLNTKNTGQTSADTSLSNFLDNFFGVCNKFAKNKIVIEYGTKYMDPRPFIAPCIKELLPSVAQIIGNQMTKATEELITRNKP